MLANNIKGLLGYNSPSTILYASKPVFNRYVGKQTDLIIHAQNFYNLLNNQNDDYIDNYTFSRIRQYLMTLCPDNLQEEHRVVVYAFLQTLLGCDVSDKKTETMQYPLRIKICSMYDIEENTGSLQILLFNPETTPISCVSILSTTLLLSFLNLKNTTSEILSDVCVLKLNDESIRDYMRRVSPVIIKVFNPYILTIEYCNEGLIVMYVGKTEDDIIASLCRHFTIFLLAPIDT